MKLTTSSAVIATLATSTVVEAGRFSSRSRQQQRQLSTYGYGEGLALEDIAGYTPGTTVRFQKNSIYLSFLIYIEYYYLCCMVLSIIGNRAFAPISNNKSVTNHPSYYSHHYHSSSSSCITIGYRSLCHRSRSIRHPGTTRRLL